MNAVVRANSVRKACMSGRKPSSTCYSIDFPFCHTCVETSRGQTTRNTDKTHETKQNHVLDCETTTMVRYELRKGSVYSAMNHMCRCM